MRQWVLSFPFQLRFLFASRHQIMGRILGIVYRIIATHLIKKAGKTHKMAHTGAVTLIQRYGSAVKKSQGAIFNSRRLAPKGGRAWMARINLNIHFHMLLLDGVYVDNWKGTWFRWAKAPTSAELTQLSQTIARRVGRFLERQGLLERDAENSYLAGDALEAGPMDQLRGHSIDAQSQLDQKRQGTNHPHTNRCPKERIKSSQTIDRTRLIPSNRNYMQQLRIYEGHTLRAGLSQMHGLRHACAQNRYEALTGWKAPAAGGPTSKMLTSEQKKIDHQARLTISHELGHEREAVSTAYLGR